MSNLLDKQLKYFRKNQIKLADEHHGEFVLISQDLEFSFHNTEIDAYVLAESKNYKEGTFLIRQCVHVDDEIELTFHSRVA